MEEVLGCSFYDLLPAKLQDCVDLAINYIEESLLEEKTDLDEKTLFQGALRLLQAVTPEPAPEAEKSEGQTALEMFMKKAKAHQDETDTV